MLDRLRAALRPAAVAGPSAPMPPPPEELDLSDLSDGDRSIIEMAKPFTMTGPARLKANIDAVRYCASRRIPGALVECGVWRGGSVMAMIGALQELGEQDRDIYLFDTFEGMTAPTELDVSQYAPAAMADWEAARRDSKHPWEEWFGPENFNEDAVRANVLATGYPAERLHFVRGPVEQTVPGGAPPEIALLRLDTDWYESTRHELQHLYPRLADGGVLIIDDYGHWDGARKAVDEYFKTAPPLLLNRIDYTGRIAIKH